MVYLAPSRPRFNFSLFLIFGTTTITTSNHLPPSTTPLNLTPPPKDHFYEIIILSKPKFGNTAEKEKQIEISGLLQWSEREEILNRKPKIFRSPKVTRLFICKILFEANAKLMQNKPSSVKHSSDEIISDDSEDDAYYLFLHNRH